MSAIIEQLKTVLNSGIATTPNSPDEVLGVYLRDEESLRAVIGRGALGEARNLLNAQGFSSRHLGDWSSDRKAVVSGIHGRLTRKKALRANRKARPVKAYGIGYRVYEDCNAQFYAERGPVREPSHRSATMDLEALSGWIEGDAWGVVTGEAS